MLVMEPADESGLGAEAWTVNYQSIWGEGGPGYGKPKADCWYLFKFYRGFGDGQGTQKRLACEESFDMYHNRG